jgi:hypothetical protein
MRGVGSWRDIPGIMRVSNRGRTVYRGDGRAFGAISSRGVRQVLLGK